MFSLDDSPPLLFFVSSVSSTDWTFHDFRTESRCESPYGTRISCDETRGCDERARKKKDIQLIWTPRYFQMSFQDSSVGWNVEWDHLGMCILTDWVILEEMSSRCCLDVLRCQSCPRTFKKHHLRGFKWFRQYTCKETLSRDQIVQMS